jgi:DNA-binding response OmpR family regulator
MARTNDEPDGEAVVEIGDLRIEPSKRSVTLRSGRIDLTFVEFEILLGLAGNPGRVFTREALLTRIWGDSAYRDPRTIDVHIRHLREKLELDAKRPDYLFTVRGVGYRFRDDDPGPGG